MFKILTHRKSRENRCEKNKYDDNLGNNKEDGLSDSLDFDDYSNEDSKSLDLGCDLYLRKENSKDEIVSITKKDILKLQRDGGYRMPVTIDGIDGYILISNESIEPLNENEVGIRTNRHKEYKFHRNDKLKSDKNILANDIDVYCNRKRNIYVWDLKKYGRVYPDEANIVMKLERQENELVLSLCGCGGIRLDLYWQKIYDWEKYANEVTKIYISEGIEKIPDFCFEGFKLIETVKIPSSVTSIGEKAFANCVSLKNIHIKVPIINLIALVFVISCQA